MRLFLFITAIKNDVIEVRSNLIFKVRYLSCGIASYKIFNYIILVLPLYICSISQQLIMSQSVNITNQKELRKLLSLLTPQTIPVWGKMKPQQMVEHLVDQVQWTNGKRITVCERDEASAQNSKQVMIYTDAEIPRNLVVEILPENYQYLDINAAIDQLMNELDDFDNYFKEPGATSIHVGFGPMTYNEWLIWHGKHFAHHLKQFGLISA